MLSKARQVLVGELALAEGSQETERDEQINTILAEGERARQAAAEAEKEAADKK